MPYSKSRSRISFEANLKNLLSLSRKASYINSGFSYEHQNLIYQSGIFLTCASIEEYLKNFIEDLIFEYRTNGAVLNELPDNMRAMMMLISQKDTFKSFVFNGDEGRAINKLQVSSNIYRIVHDDDVFNYHANARTIIGTKKYPSTKNLKILYNRLGIKNILHKAFVRGQRDYKTQLESFLSVREAISHQAPPSLTFLDVQRNFENIQALINILDRITFSHIVSISNENYWPN